MLTNQDNAIAQECRVKAGSKYNIQEEESGIIARKERMKWTFLRQGVNQEWVGEETYLVSQCGL